MASNVILVGFMGAGKSSVGRILARRLGRCLVETDEMIVAKEGMSIPEIFAAKGEAYFRALEEEMRESPGAQERRRHRHGRRFALPRGSPGHAASARRPMVWLSGDFDVLYHRALAGGAAADAGGPEPRGGGSALSLADAFYAQADIAVDTTTLGPDQVAAQVAAALRSRERSARERTAR